MRSEDDRRRVSDTNPYAENDAQAACLLAKDADQSVGARRGLLTMPAPAPLDLARLT